MSAFEGERYLKDSRYIRWQGVVMAQFTVAIALVSGLSVSALGMGLSLLQHEDFARSGPYGIAFVLALLLFVIVTIFCAFSTVSRTLDFRLTARKVRGRTDLVIFGLSNRGFGRLSWGLFWVAMSAFVVGAALFLASVGSYIAFKFVYGH